MHTGNSEDERRNLAVEAIAAEGALREMESRAGWTKVPEEFVPREAAMRGLAVAIPLSLSLWVVIGLLVWALAR